MKRKLVETKINGVSVIYADPEETGNCFEITARQCNERVDLGPREGLPCQQIAAHEGPCR